MNYQFAREMSFIYSKRIAWEEDISRWQSRRMWYWFSPMSTRIIHLHVEKCPWETNWKLAGLLYNKICKEIYTCSWVTREEKHHIETYVPRRWLKDKKKLYGCTLAQGSELFESQTGVAFIVNKSPKCSILLQTQKQQNELGSFSRQIIQ